jgi:SNF family Na+-dependent transporter
MASPQQGPGRPSQQNIIQFIKEHKWESFAYFILFCGLILSVFDKMVGGAIVGLIIGIYFSDFFKEKAQDFKKFIHDEGVFRGFIIIAAVIALLIIAFGLCIGTIIGTVIKPYLPET